jgi:hypothetical protein
MIKKVKMCGFVYGDCDLVKESRTFVSVWLMTKGNPCLKCGTDKNECSFYKELAAKGHFNEEENPR